MSALTRLHRREKPAPIAIDNGHPIRLRGVQSLYWGIAAGACGAAFVAGLYFNLLEVNWHVFWLKHWWDSGMGIIHSPSWDLYRHGERDLGEPAAATLAVRTLLANRKLWATRISAWNIIARGAGVLAAAAGLIAGAVWVINFGIPKLAALPFAAAYLAAGFIIGQVLHRIWAPAGATLQGMIADRSADRARLDGHVPFWVRKPAAPPQPRERFVWIVEHDTDVRARSNWLRPVLPLIALVTAYLVVTGFIAHYWIGTGHSFPFLAP